jgi:hypothetical protein
VQYYYSQPPRGFQCRACSPLKHTVYRTVQYNTVPYSTVQCRTRRPPAVTEAGFPGPWCWLQSRAPGGCSVDVRRVFDVVFDVRGSLVAASSCQNLPATTYAGMLDPYPSTPQSLPSWGKLDSRVFFWQPCASDTTASTHLQLSSSKTNRFLLDARGFAEFVWPAY